MIKQFLLAAALAASATITHTTGTLATRDTYGAWATVSVNVPEGRSTVLVSASADGKNTPLDCTFLNNRNEVVGSCKKATACQAPVNNTPPYGGLPSHLTLKLTNEYNGPVMYDISVETK